MKKFIVLLLLLNICSYGYAGTIAKSVSIKDTDKETLSELERFLGQVKTANNDNAIRQLCWYVNGNVATGASQQQTYNNFPFDLVPVDVIMKVDTAPVGSALIIDINDDGSTIFGTRPQIADGATEDSGAHVFNAGSEIASGSDVSFDVDQIGSGTAGADLTVCLYGRVQ